MISTLHMDTEKHVMAVFIKFLKETYGLEKL